MCAILGDPCVGRALSTAYIISTFKLKNFYKTLYLRFSFICHNRRLPFIAALSVKRAYHYYLT